MKKCKDCKHAIPTKVKDTSGADKTVNYCHEAPPHAAMIPNGQLMVLFPEVSDDMYCSRWVRRIVK